MARRDTFHNGGNESDNEAQMQQLLKMVSELKNF